MPGSVLFGKGSPRGKWPDRDEDAEETDPDESPSEKKNRQLAQVEKLAQENTLVVLVQALMLKLQRKKGEKGFGKSMIGKNLRDLLHEEREAGKKGAESPSAEKKRKR